MGNVESSASENAPVKREVSEDGGAPIEKSSSLPSEVGTIVTEEVKPLASSQNAATSADIDKNEDDDKNSRMILVDCGHCKGALEAKVSTTISELYNLIIQDFDDEMIPGGGLIGDDSENNKTCNDSFSFLIWIQGVQPTKKQANRVTVSDVIRNNWTIQLVEKFKPTSLIPAITPTNTNANINSNGKRLREDENKEKINENHNESCANERTSLSPRPQEALPTLTATTISTTASSNLSSDSYAALPDKNQHHNFDPSPFKRSRIFANSISTEVKDNSKENDASKMSSLVDTCIRKTKQSIALTERQISESGGHNDDASHQQNSAESNNESSFVVEKLTSENDAMQQNSSRVSNLDERLSNNAHVEDERDHGNKIGMIDFNTDMVDESDGDTVHMSLSPSNEDNYEEDGNFREVESNEIRGSDKGSVDNVSRGDELVPMVVVEKDDPHAKYDSALKRSCQTLMGIEKMLSDNKTNDEGVSFCSEARSDEWRKEIQDQLSSGTSGPKTIVGVLGSTGVGKSSLLNALLDEAAVLPTSGSRGCTAAVVELTYNRDLIEDTTLAKSKTSSIANNAGKKIPVYKGKVEFIKLEEWRAELKLLVDECSTKERTIYIRCPEEKNQPDAAAAWAKIDQVYGRGTMANFSGRSTTSVFERLLTNSRVVNLLTPKPNSQEPYNAVYIEEGLIDPADAASTVLRDYEKMGLRTRRNLKRWAKSFRSKINDYVYRKGNGHQAQTWPLIRLVSLQGPWNVLSSGGVLVDLPGVRDANAARARVSERYLQNCNQIWVVAPIKRAVDDGTAKELMGEQFKRRLLMDGQYGNIAFICTQTDDCEATEIMRDHGDIAVKIPGRWEKMTSFRDRINNIETNLSDLKQQEEDLQFAVDEAKDLLEELSTNLQNANTPTEISDDDESFQLDDDQVDTDVLAVKNRDEKIKKELMEQVSNQKLIVEEHNKALLIWRDAHKDEMGKLSSDCNNLQRKLKTICAGVRNEYSTKCLQDDFITGLKEIYRDADESPEDEESNVEVPSDISLPVFCISANDYLKVTGIKPSSDGPPNCFCSPADTQIHRLREFVHSTTASRRVHFTKNFLNRTSDLLDRVKLLANDSRTDACGTRQKVRSEEFFLNEMENLSKKLDTVGTEFLEKADQKVMHTLKPSLAAGAQKAQSTAMSTVHSWGSKCRRTRNERTAERNGLYYSTYFATARRDGVYVSQAAGPIDLNAELMEPMEAEFTPAWQSIMDGAIRNLISESERKVIGICKELDRVLLRGFCSIGIEKARVSSMVSISASNCENAVRTNFSAMRDTATENQRELSRSLLPQVQQSMRTSYNETISVSGGTGKFSRMKDSMQSNSRVAINKVFSECMDDLLKGIDQMVQAFSTRINLVKETISKSLSGVYSILWEDQNAGRIVDFALQQKILACRTACLPLLSQLRKEQDEIMQVLGIERPTLDLEIAAVETWEQQNTKNIQMAKENGEFVELLDDSEDDEAEPTDTIRPPAVKEEVKTECARFVKTEIPSSESSGRHRISNETINLLDSSDDDSDYDEGDNTDYDVRCVVVEAGELGMKVGKVPEGFFVASISKDSQLAGKLFLGDILKSMDGKRLSKLDMYEFTTQLKESSNKRKRRLYVLRPKVALRIKAGKLGLSLDKSLEGFHVSKVNRDSQLLGKVFVGDIITSVDGTRLVDLDEDNGLMAFHNTFDKADRRICIIRRRKDLRK